jgi:Zn-dependent alcohol dehydrogenase
MPHILGEYGAGVVVEIGKNVSNVKKMVTRFASILRLVAAGVSFV